MPDTEAALQSTNAYVVTYTEWEHQEILGVYDNEATANEVMTIMGRGHDVEKFALNAVPLEVVDKVMQEVTRLRKLVPNA